MVMKPEGLQKKGVTAMISAIRNTRTPADHNQARRLQAANGRWTRCRRRRREKKPYISALSEDHSVAPCGAPIGSDNVPEEKSLEKDEDQDVVQRRNDNRQLPYECKEVSKEVKEVKM